MKKILFIVGVVAILWIVYFLKTLDVKRAEILPADSKEPASGICVSAPEKGNVSVTVAGSGPSPRCQQINSQNTLTITNPTAKELQAWFGDKKEFSFSIPAKGEYKFSESLGDLFAPGVHILHNDLYDGPEIVMVSDTPDKSLESFYLYKFSDFPVNGTNITDYATVNYDAFPMASKYKSKFGDTPINPNFAGHYSVIELISPNEPIGFSGKFSYMYAIVDVNSGTIVEYGLTSQFPLEYQFRSNLLIANSPKNIEGLPGSPKDGGIVTEYFEMNNGKLTVLARQNAGEKSGQVCAQVISRAKNVFSAEERDFASPCLIPFGWEYLGR